MSQIRLRDGLTLEYFARGRGRPVVFVHALSMTQHMWENQLLALADTYRVISYDQRGHGASDKPEGPYDIATYADDLASLLATLGLNDVTLVGCSIGSWIAIDYVTRIRERVSKLVITGTTPKLMRSPDWPLGADPAMFEALFAKLTDDRSTVTAEFYRSVMSPKTSQAMLDRIVGMSLNMPLYAYLESGTSCAINDFRPRLGDIRVPTLVVNGRHDVAIVPEVTDYIVGAIAGARGLLLEDSGHFAALETPNVLNAALREFIGTP